MRVEKRLATHYNENPTELKGSDMHQPTTSQNLMETALGAPLRGFSEGGSKVPELVVYTRHEHGNLQVRVRAGEDGQTRYEMEVPTDEDASGRRTVVFSSARALMRELYGHDVNISFDRYFRLGRYRLRGRASGSSNILTLLDAGGPSTRHTSISLHSSARPRGRRTSISIASAGWVGSDFPAEVKQGRAGVRREVGGTSDPVLEDLVRALEGDLLPQDEFVVPTREMLEEFERSFALELDRLEGLVGIELGRRSERSGSKTRADEVRRLLWRGFAGKMLSAGYDPDDVLQEVYRGLLVRNAGRCPWDARKSTFGHYVHMCIDSILTNYHRKQQRRADRHALPLTGHTKEGEEVDLAWGSSEIHEGSEIGDMMALQGLQRHVEEVADESEEGRLAREILPLVASGHQRAEIVRKTGERPSAVSRALAWLRAQAAVWARRGDMAGMVPSRYRTA